MGHKQPPTPMQTVNKTAHSSSSIHLEEKLYQTFTTHKNGVINVTETQCWTGKHLCLVQFWANIITMLESYPVTSYNTPVNTVWLKNHRTTIITQMTENCWGQAHSPLERNLLYSHTNKWSPIHSDPDFPGSYSYQEYTWKNHHNWVMIHPFLPPVHPNSIKWTQKRR